MLISSYFSDTYAEARAAFLVACAARGLPVESLYNSNAEGAQGEALFTDIVRIGRVDARKVLLLTSGTHGVEGYCGSGVQVGLLRAEYFADLPDDISVVMIHAMNPFGFSHNRRVNEDNVDLNRNFIYFDAPRGAVGAYGDLHAHILPDAWDGPQRQAADAAIEAFIQAHGLSAFQAAVTEGQYHFADGMYYGGARPVWSHKMFADVLERYTVNAHDIGVIDVHSGLGPYGYGEIMMDGEGEQKARIRQWYGAQATDTDDGTSSSAPLTGTLWHGAMQVVSDKRLTFVTLEFGTYEVTRVIEAMRADNWLYQRGRVDSDLGRAIKQEIKDTFYPDADDWKAMVWARACEVVGMAVAGLAGA